MHKQKGFKIVFGRFKLNLGKDDLTQIEIDSLRDIQIWYEDELGSYHVKWDSLKNMLPPGTRLSDSDQSGYVVRFTPKANDPSLQPRFEQIRTRLRALRGQPNSMMEILTLQSELMEISQGANDVVEVSNRSFKLAEELDLRYQITDPLPTYLLRQLVRTHGQNQPCSELLKRQLSNI